MTRLRFEPAPQVPLPVTIYDDQQRMVTRTLSSSSLDLDPGTYYLAARPPVGPELGGVVEVGAAETVAALSTPQPGPGRAGRETRRTGFGYAPAEALRESAPGPPSLGRSFGGLTEPIARIIGLSLPLRHEEGEWIPSAMAALYLERPARVEPGVEGVLHRAFDDDLVWFSPIPGGRSDLLRFEPRTAPQGRASFSWAGLAEPVADALLAYAGQGQTAGAVLLAELQAEEAERLLDGEDADPIAAAAAAFVLLQTNALDQLRAWTGILAERFPWLPDGIVVLADHLAREGRHDEAAARLRALPDAGVPVLSAGLDVAVDRLRRYAAYWPTDRGLSLALTYLSDIALATDFSLPVTTTLVGDGADPALQIK